MEEVIFTNAHVVDPGRGIDGKIDIGVRDGMFAPPETLRSPHKIDLTGKVLCPGFIDLKYT